MRRRGRSRDADRRRLHVTFASHPLRWRSRLAPSIEERIICWLVLKTRLGVIRIRSFQLFVSFQVIKTKWRRIRLCLIISKHAKGHNAYAPTLTIPPFAPLPAFRLDEPVLAMPSPRFSKLAPWPPPLNKSKPMAAASRRLFSSAMILAFRALAPRSAKRATGPSRTKSMRWMAKLMPS